MIFAIGDIHGQCQKLTNLLDQLAQFGMTDEDTLVFIGDYIDRGPDTKGVLDLLIHLEATRANTIFLRGNHEQMILDARERFDSDFDAKNPLGTSETGTFWFTEGSAATLASYNKKGVHWVRQIPEEHWQFMLRTRMEFELLQYLFVHAGIVPKGVKFDFNGIPVDPRLWIRYEFIASQDDFGGRIVIFGHTPTSSGEPMIQTNKIAIDTGAGYGGPLTAVLLPPIFRSREVRVFQAV